MKRKRQSRLRFFASIPCRIYTIAFGVGVTMPFMPFPFAGGVPLPLDGLDGHDCDQVRR
jgi:hypothetical protein